MGFFITVKHLNKATTSPGLFSKAMTVPVGIPVLAIHSNLTRILPGKAGCWQCQFLQFNFFNANSGKQGKGTQKKKKQEERIWPVPYLTPMKIGILLPKGL